MINELLNKRFKWYSNVAVQREIVKAMKNREVVFMSNSNSNHCIRGLRIDTIEMLNYFFDAFHFADKDYNIYVSCAKYKYIPVFTLNLSERSKETQVFFKNLSLPNSLNNFFDFDILLDFDLKHDKQNIPKNLRKIQKLISDLDSNRICFRFYNSSDFGIHIIINFMVNNLSLNSIDLNVINNFINMIAERYNFNLKKLNILDNNGNSNILKIRKCEYSLVNDIVVLPSKNIHIDFNFNNFDSNIVLRNEIINNRGLCFHNNAGMVNNYNSLLIFSNLFLLHLFDNFKED